MPIPTGDAWEDLNKCQKSKLIYFQIDVIKCSATLNVDDDEIGLFSIWLYLFSFSVGYLFFSQPLGLPFMLDALFRSSNKAA